MPCEIRIAWHPQWDQLLSIAPQELEGKPPLLVAESLVYFVFPRCRSGTFVLVDTCLLEAQLSGTQAVNVKERLLDMRTYR